MVKTNRLSNDIIKNHDNLHFHVVAEKSPDAFITINSKGKIISWNWAAEKLFGYPHKEMIGKNITVIMPERFKLQHRRGMNHFFKTGKGRFMGKPIIVAGLRADGSEFPIELSLSAWYRDGETYVTGIIRDISKRLEAEELCRYRLEKERVLSSIATRFVSDNLDEAIRSSLADIGNTAQASRTFLILFDGNRETISQSAEWHAAGIAPDADNLGNYKFDEFTWIYKKIFNKETVIINDVADLPDEAAAEKTIFERTQIKSLVAIPIERRDKTTIGFIGFGNFYSKQNWNNEDISLLKKMSDLLAVAMKRNHEIVRPRAGEKIINYRKNKQVINEIMSSLFRVPAEIVDIDFTHFYQIVSSDINLVSGDFYDLFEIEKDKLAILIGDVSGRGLAAVATASKIVNAVKAHAFQSKSVSRIVSSTNDLLLKTADTNVLVTLFFGVLNKKTGTLHFCSAGHPPVIVRRSENVSLLHARSPAIGIYSFLGFIDEEINLRRGDFLVLYTDGLTKARQDEETFDINRLVEVISRSRFRSSDDIRKTIEKEAIDFAGPSLKDDYALLIVSRERRGNRQLISEMENIFNLISTSETATETFRSLTEGLNRLLHVSGTCVFSVDRKEGKLKGLLGMPADVWPHIDRVTIDLEDETSGAALAARTKKVVTIDQIKQDTTGKRWLMDYYKPKSLLFLPIIANDIIIGVAVAMDKEAYRTFAENDVNSALLLTSKAALVISEKSR